MESFGLALGVIRSKTLAFSIFRVEMVVSRLLVENRAAIKWIDGDSRTLFRDWRDGSSLARPRDTPVLVAVVVL